MNILFIEIETIETLFSDPAKNAPLMGFGSIGSIDSILL